MISQIEIRRENSEQLIHILNQIQGVIESSVYEEDTMGSLVTKLIDLIVDFQIELLPYAAISQFVYSNESEDLLYFVDPLEKKFIEICGDELTPTFIKFMKLMEHMDLAKQQKDFLFSKQESELLKLKETNSLLESELRITKELNVNTGNMLQTTIKLGNKVRKLKKEIKGITAQFIGILGIFAAILLGSIGAMQGFTSLFNNANKMSLGKLLIINSIGASSVILILFFLLNAVAKLTDKPLESTDDRNGSIILRYPTLTISFGIIALITLIGASLELSNFPLKFSWYGLWWGLPLVWVIYFIIAVHKKSFTWFVKRKNKSLLLIRVLKTLSRRLKKNKQSSNHKELSN